MQGFFVANKVLWVDRIIEIRYNIKNEKYNDLKLRGGDKNVFKVCRKLYVA